MSDFEYCAACLVADVKMYNLDTKYASNSSSTLRQSLLKLLQTRLDKSFHICFECTNLLIRFHDFKTKCLKVQSILSTLEHVDDPETIKGVIQSVDREFCKLKSNLMLSYVINTNNGQYVEDLKTVDAKPSMNLALNKEAIEEDITSRKRVNNNKKHQKKYKDYIKNVSSDVEDESVYEDGTNLNENNEIMTDSDTQNESNLETDSDDMPTEYINYSDEDSFSSPSDNVLFTKRNIDTAQAAVSNITKRRIKDNINSEYEDSSDEEPLSKLFKTLEENHTEKRYSKISDTKLFEGFITVVQLSPEDVEKEILLRKESTSYKRSKFKCGICNRGYATKAAYENHMKRHSPEFGKFKCEFCHMRFPQDSFLSTHHTNCHKWNFLCQICPYTTHAVNAARLHTKLHKGKGFSCEECGKLFAKTIYLMTHKQKKHIIDCVCECGISFATPRGLHEHKKKTHWKERG